MTHYFVNRNVSRGDGGDGIGRYWRKTEAYSGWGQPGDRYATVAGTSTNAKLRFQVNLSLLATLLEDPATLVPPAFKLVDPIDYRACHREDILSAGEETTISLQPREALASWGPMELPIGSLLAAFLDDPLKLGRPLNLGLPFLDPQASVSKTWIRSGINAFHGGLTFRFPRSLVGTSLASTCAPLPTESSGCSSTIPTPGTRGVWCCSMSPRSYTLSLQRAGAWAGRRLRPRTRSRLLPLVCHRSVRRLRRPRDRVGPLQLRAAAVRLTRKAEGGA